MFTRKKRYYYSIRNQKGISIKKELDSFPEIGIPNSNDNNIKNIFSQYLSKKKNKEDTKYVMKIPSIENKYVSF